MAIKLSTSCRSACVNAIKTTVGSSGKLRIYSGTQPAGPDTAISTQTLLAELTLNSTFAPDSTTGVLTLNAITDDSAADATGTAAFFRMTTSGGTAHMDGSVTATGGGGDLTFNTVAIQQNVAVGVSSFTITAGNA